MDKLVIDIETKNTFADVGGQHNIGALEASFVGIYSYNQNKYLSFFEDNWAALGRLLQTARVIIGFSINRFDIPVLAKYFQPGKLGSGVNFNIHALEKYDLLDEIEQTLGFRVSLDVLAKTNLNVGKTSHGLEAIKFYKEGRLKELESYCLNDVKITKDLYDLAKARGHLFIPERTTGELIKANLKINEVFMPATLF
jgi:DEAD/DEAH box helicase domain-containing protein